MSDHMPSRPRLPALWFGLFGAPAAWTVMFMVSYAMSAHSCYPHDTPLSTPTLGGLRGLIAAVMMGAIVVAAAAGAVALAAWRATNDEVPGIEGARASHEVRAHWMALGGMLVSILFLFLIALSGVPVLMVPPCSYGA